jgi:antirestriction protein ArdC/phage/plasmid primase-like uncharacterized protein
MASNKYSEHAEELAQQLIRMVESGKAPWQKGYVGGFSEPTSFLTDKPYQNSNALRLLFTGIERGYEDNRWITKNQIEKEGGSITDYRKGVPILYYSDSKTVREKDEETGEVTKKKVKLSRPVLKSSVVFNIQDVEGLPEKQRQSPEQLGWKQADILQELKELTGIDVKLSDKPFYVPSSDQIAMPAAEAYTNEKIYAETLIHETIHWTGHTKRLDRLDENAAFGSKAYAREELVAEIGTLLTAQKAGVEIEHDNSKSYIQNWWKPLKEELEKNPKLILDIAKDAYCARDYILDGKELDRLHAASVSHHIELTDQELESGRVNFEVPFSEKNAAKALARSLEIDLKWDRKGKTWFAKLDDGQNIGDLAKYRITDEAQQGLETQRLNLKIPFAQKDNAKATAKELGLKLQWDKKGKTWFINIEPGSDIGDLAKYAPKEYAKPMTTLGQQDKAPPSDSEKGADPVVKHIIHLHRQQSDGTRELAEKYGIDIQIQRDECHFKATVAEAEDFEYALFQHGYSKSSPANKVLLANGFENILLEQKEIAEASEYNVEGTRHSLHKSDAIDKLNVLARFDRRSHVEMLGLLTDEHRANQSIDTGFYNELRHEAHQLDLLSIKIQKGHDTAYDHRLFAELVDAITEVNASTFEEQCWQMAFSLSPEIHDPFIEKVHVAHQKLQNSKEAARLDSLEAQLIANLKKNHAHIDEHNFPDELVDNFVQTVARFTELNTESNLDPVSVAKVVFEDRAGKEGILSRVYYNNSHLPKEQDVAIQRINAADHAKAITEGNHTLITLLNPVTVEATQVSINTFIDYNKDVTYLEMVDLVSNNITHIEKEDFKQALLDAEITRAEELFKPMNAPESEFDEVKFNFQIPYTRKDEAKELAKKFELQLRWDSKEKNWYAYAMKEKGQKFQEELTKLLAPSAPKKDSSSDRVSLNIPFHIKDEAKQIAKNLGFSPRWNGKQWTAKISEETAKEFKKALVEALDAKEENGSVAEPSTGQQKLVENDESQKIYLHIPYEEKDQAKAEAKKLKMPLKYDAETRTWFTYKDKIQPFFEKFIPDENSVSHASNGADDSLFSALTNIGVASAPSEIKLDGKFHRLKDVNDKRGESSIAYRGYDNGVPNATIINHKTGERVKWVGKSPELSREERDTLSVINKNREEEFRAKSLKERDETAKLVRTELESSPPADSNHQYLVKKGIGSHSFKKDSQGNLIVPLTNVKGEIRNVQRINKDGQKWYAKGGEKQGNFHAISKPENGKPILIAEGVATAATLNEVLKIPALAALDAGNLSEVAKSLSEVYPDSPLIIAGDNDHQKPYLDPPKENVGYNKAKAAAKEVGADFLAPHIEDPANASDSDMRITDFNDLVTERGKDTLKEAFRTTLATLKVRRTREVDKPISRNLNTTTKDHDGR